eukprot:6302327-Prymnesium_polylepis.1
MVVHPKRRAVGGDAHHEEEHPPIPLRLAVELAILLGCPEHDEGARRVRQALLPADEAGGRSSEERAERKHVARQIAPAASIVVQRRGDEEPEVQSE